MTNVEFHLQLNHNGGITMNKVYSLHDAVAKFVESGDCVCFGGFTTNRKPYAVVNEILRQGQGAVTRYFTIAILPQFLQLV